VSPVDGDVLQDADSHEMPARSSAFGFRNFMGINFYWRGFGVLPIELAEIFLRVLLELRQAAIAAEFDFTTFVNIDERVAH
jgi:hypothetical protein